MAASIDVILLIAFIYLFLFDIADTELRGLVEALGCYMIYSPSKILLRVAAVLNDVVTAQISAIGGKSAKVRAIYQLFVL